MAAVWTKPVVQEGFKLCQDQEMIKLNSGQPHVSFADP